jgi:hypothetical protein
MLRKHPRLVKPLNSLCQHLRQGLSVCGHTVALRLDPHQVVSSLGFVLSPKYQASK